MITRLDSQCHAYIVTKSENSVRTLYVGFTPNPPKEGLGDSP